LLVNKTNEQRYIDKQMGFTAGQADVVSDPLGMLVGGVTGLVTALGSPIDTASGAWQNFKEIGSYDGLLKLQGRDYELGYQEGQTQGGMALGAVGAPIMEVFGSSLLQGAMTRANGGTVNISTDGNGQATGLSMQTSTDFKWNNAVSNTDGDFGYLNQNPKTGSGADFYVGSSGPESTLPSTGYRYMRLYNDDGTINSRATDTINNGTARLSYFGFEKFESGAEVIDAFQVRGPQFVTHSDPDPSWSDGRLRVTFDTLQLYQNGSPRVSAPFSFGGTGDVLEPFTFAYPQYGKGGAQQLIPTQDIDIEASKIDLLPEKKTNE
jgi:hypothetical protein